MKGRDTLRKWSLGRGVMPTFCNPQGITDTRQVWPGEGKQSLAKGQ